MKGDFIKKFNTVNKGNFNSNFYEIFGTLPGERLIKGDRLIWGSLNTGSTVYCRLDHCVIEQFALLQGQIAFNLLEYTNSLWHFLTQIINMFVEIKFFVQFHTQQPLIIDLFNFITIYFNLEFSTWKLFSIRLPVTSRVIFWHINSAHVPLNRDDTSLAITRSLLA